MSSYLVHWPMGVVCRARSASQRRQQLIDRLFAWKCCSRETFAHVRWWIAIKFGACANAFEMRSVPRAMILTGECGMYWQVLFFELYELSSGNAMDDSKSARFFTIYGLFGFPSSASNLAEAVLHLLLLLYDITLGGDGLTNLAKEIGPPLGLAFPLMSHCRPRFSTHASVQASA